MNTPVCLRSVAAALLMIFASICQAQQPCSYSLPMRPDDIEPPPDVCAEEWYRVTSTIWSRTSSIAGSYDPYAAHYTGTASAETWVSSGSTLVYNYLGEVFNSKLSEESNSSM